MPRTAQFRHAPGALPPRRGRDRRRGLRRLGAARRSAYKARRRGLAEHPAPTCHRRAPSSPYPPDTRRASDSQASCRDRPRGLDRYMMPPGENRSRLDRPFMPATAAGSRSPAESRARHDPSCGTSPSCGSTARRRCGPSRTARWRRPAPPEQRGAGADDAAANNHDVDAVGNSRIGTDRIDRGRHGIDGSLGCLRATDQPSTRPPRPWPLVFEPFQA